MKKPLTIAAVAASLLMAELNTPAPAGPLGRATFRPQAVATGHKADRFLIRARSWPRKAIVRIAVARRERKENR